jgi:hypothetical protein
MQMTTPTVFGPEPIVLDGRRGCRYWVSHPFSFTGSAPVDERLSDYPVVVFQPDRRACHETPVVIGLQGMAAPYQWNAFLVSTLLDMGIACVLFETPLAGERSLVRNYQADIVSEIAPLAQHGVRIGSSLFSFLLEAVARDCQTVRALIRDRHGLTEERLALFGVSLGTLLAGFVFNRDRLGIRLLGTIGHADLPGFARSYSPSFTTLLTSYPARILGKIAGQLSGPGIPATLDFLRVLRTLGSEAPESKAANPMTFVERVGPDRRVRFLVGDQDALVNPEDAIDCARRYPDGECFVVPGLGHGHTQNGPDFVEHVRYFLGTQLGDWKW